MRHHLQNTCSKQAHILLNVKPVKLQITAPGPRGARWPRVVWTSIWVYRPSLSGRHGWFEAVSCASAGQGRGRCTLWGQGPGAGSQKDKSHLHEAYVDHSSYHRHPLSSLQNDTTISVIPCPFPPAQTTL